MKEQLIVETGYPDKTSELAALFVERTCALEQAEKLRFDLAFGESAVPAEDVAQRRIACHWPREHPRMCGGRHRREPIVAGLQSGKEAADSPVGHHSSRR